MKKITAILLALTLVFAMAACGTDIPTKAATDADKTEAPAPSSSEKPAESTPAATEPELTEAAATTPEAAQPTEPAPVETKVPETAPSEQAPETAPPETAPAETLPPETAPVETAPPETQAPETTPEETAPPETKPEETAPVETVPAETEVHADKAAYYETYLGSEDMKQFGDVTRGIMTLNGVVYMIMSYGPNTIIMEGEGGRIELYKKDTLLYARVYVKPADGNEGEDNWFVCDMPEEEDPFDNLGGPGDILEDAGDGSTKLTYLYSFMEDGVEYDYVLMEPTDPSDDPESAQKAYMTVRADTHEIVSMDAEIVDPDDPETVQGQRIEFLEESSIAMPEDVAAESVDYETLMMAVFMALMTVMSDLF